MTQPDTNLSLEAKGVSFSYRTNTPVLEEVAMRIQGGSFMAILGNNGVGKSTFLHCLNRILTPSSGEITIEGREVKDFKRVELARAVALVAQHSHAGRLTVFDSVLLGRKPHIDLGPTEDDLVIVESVLERLGLGEMALRYVDELSGGEYQKVILARSLAQKTGVLLLDEPTNNLDLHNQHEVMRTIRNVVDSDNIAAVAVMHDINLSLRYCDAFLFFKDGKIYGYGGHEAVTEEAIEAVYSMKVDIIEHDGRKVVVPQ